jgi:hypothetical protein
MLCIWTLLFKSQNILCSVDSFAGLLRGFMYNNYQFAEEINNTTAKNSYVYCITILFKNKLNVSA